MTAKKIALAAGLACSLAGALLVAGADVASADDQGCPYGPGMGYGMMGQGYGPGMMGYGMMGPGMMGQGYGPGMMGPGFGQGTGPGMMNREQAALTVDDVRKRLERHLAMQGNPNLKLGKVEKAKDGKITAEIVTKDGSLVDKYEVDNGTGWMRPVR